MCPAYGYGIIPMDEPLARSCSFQWEKQLFPLSDFPKTPSSWEKVWNICSPQGNVIPRSSAPSRWDSDLEFPLWEWWFLPAPSALQIPTNRALWKNPSVPKCWEEPRSSKIPGKLLGTGLGRGAGIVVMELIPFGFGNGNGLKG